MAKDITARIKLQHIYRKKEKNMGDPAQLNLISKLPANTVKGAIGYKLLSILQRKLMR